VRYLPLVLLTGCIIIPIPLSSGGDDETNDEELLQLHDRCTTLSDAQSCGIAGRIYEEGAGVDADPVRATEYYDEACRLGSATGCEDGRRMRATLEQ
jgi:TPR repeat protein